MNGGRLMGIDLDGVFYTIRGAVPSFVRRRQGAIVTISSMWEPRERPVRHPIPPLRRASSV